MSDQSPQDHSTLPVNERPENGEDTAWRENFSGTTLMAPFRILNPATGHCVLMVEVNNEGEHQIYMEDPKTGCPVVEMYSGQYGGNFGIADPDSVPRALLLSQKHGGGVLVKGLSGTTTVALLADEDGGEVEVMDLAGDLAAVLSCNDDANGGGELILWDRASRRSRSIRESSGATPPGDAAGVPPRTPRLNTPRSIGPPPAGWEKKLPDELLYSVLLKDLQCPLSDDPRRLSGDAQAWQQYLGWYGQCLALTIRSEIELELGGLGDEPRHVAQAVLLWANAPFCPGDYSHTRRPHQLTQEERTVLYPTSDDWGLDVLELFAWSVLTTESLTGPLPLIISARWRDEFMELLHEVLKPAVNLMVNTLICGDGSAPAAPVQEQANAA